MKAVTRSAIAGTVAYAGLTLAGWLAVSGKLIAAYCVVFLTCIVSVGLGSMGNTDNEVDQ